MEEVCDLWFWKGEAEEDGGETNAGTEKIGRGAAPLSSEGAGVVVLKKKASAVSLSFSEEEGPWFLGLHLIF